MARKALIEKSKRKPKYKSRLYLRCKVCGRSRGLITKFYLCRICFREFMYKGYLPGIRKASW